MILLAAASGFATLPKIIHGLLYLPERKLRQAR
jgi:hypothetical protein